jgi:hypothetical protein
LSINGYWLNYYKTTELSLRGTACPELVSGKQSHAIQGGRASVRLPRYARKDMVEKPHDKQNGWNIFGSELKTPKNGGTSRKKAFCF